MASEVTRAAFTAPWKRWMPDASRAGTLGAGEPALIVIAGDLHAYHVPGFVRDLPGAVAGAFAHPGYLGGLGISSSPLDTTSCSCWRTYRDAQEFAFGPGDHADAMRRDRVEGRHTTERFLRLRPRDGQAGDISRT